ncbi:MAG TPA: hypothetical protein VJ698_18640 [Noviherbaspirillum sp.]|uniref:hypothetical protein n=1 Tax=Noviherbaspirillum sp. TaxID=1926288 RepID=UPI002B47A5CC|nr:hypothetical protein [Noviherbaspirillum sp.]HJV87494.1 hypothetical protein [Noviherbaspirillum sp.]
MQIAPHVPRDVASFPGSAKESSAPPQHAVPARPYARVPQVPAPRIPPPAVTEKTPVGPQAPVPVVTCDPAGCWVDGKRYEGGAGGTFLDRNGRMCQGNGSWIQCF